MSINKYTAWLFPFLVIALSSCAVISSQVSDEALPDVGFEDLIANSEQYIGETVVLGGYVAQVRNKQDFTELVLVQAPLGRGQMPKGKDLSQGRLILEYDGFLDPEVYTRDRMITVGGTVIGGSQTGDPAQSYPYIRLEVRDLYLWPEQEYDPFWYYYNDMWWDVPGPYFWGSHTYYPWHLRHRRYPAW